MPFMPAVRLNQRSEALPKRDPLFSLGVLLRFFPPFSVFACAAVISIFWPSQRLLSERERPGWCSV